MKPKHAVKRLRFHYDNGTWSLLFSSKDKGDKCQVLFCRNLRRTQVRKENGGLRRVNHTICQTCSNQIWRLNNPLQYLYNKIRDRARARNQPFTIRLLHFFAAIKCTPYVTKHGRSSADFHLDRVINKKGYIPGNIKPIPAHENIRKSNSEPDPF